MNSIGHHPGSRCGEDPLPGPHVSIEPIAVSILFKVYKGPVSKRLQITGFVLRDFSDRLSSAITARVQTDDTKFREENILRFTVKTKLPQP
ncbi:hypothetical protein CBS147333_4613 [Penicillium roqueforti]|nr:hypothetical protein CBS147355_1601 [Penicillium roqueforti]KAI3110751.1 hypothetical protein CBS147333_4613 [Penicillium roqueforti]KAI3269556.1 hypothetical protein CBS147308_5394 [Penicillium roqueforti]KAI3290308.1 hypothetical protein DTO003C3_4770 [Penicillium roqueforti]